MSWRERWLKGELGRRCSWTHGSSRLMRIREEVVHLCRWRRDKGMLRYRRRLESKDVAAVRGAWRRTHGWRQSRLQRVWRHRPGGRNRLGNDVGYLRLREERVGSRRYHWTARVRRRICVFTIFGCRHALSLSLNAFIAFFLVR